MPLLAPDLCMKEAFTVGNCAFDDISGRNRFGRISEDNQTVHERTAFELYR